MKMKSQKGFTLIELIIAFGVAAIISGGVTVAINQLFTGNSRTTAHMTAVKEVENAVHWLTKDSETAQSIMMPTSGNFPLTFKWVEWNNNKKIDVTYHISDGHLMRTYSEDESVQSDIIIVAHYNTAESSYVCDANIFSFTITSTVGKGSTIESETRLFSINPRCAPVIVSFIPPPSILTNSPLPNGDIGDPYTQTLVGINGIPPYTWSMISGNLPTGLTFSSGGVISGTPTTSGTSSFTIQLADSDTPPQTATKAYTITINEPLTIETTSPLPHGEVSVSYSQTITASGGSGSYTWSIVSVTPTSGFVPSINSDGVLSSTPTLAGNYSVIVRATDSANTSHTVSKAFAVSVSLHVTTTSPLTGGYVGVSYSQNLGATGGGTGATYTWSGSSLPPGLTLSAAGVVSGTPTTAGTYTITANVLDNQGHSGTATLQITIYNALNISTASPLPNGFIGVTYSQSLTAIGGVSPYTWARTSGSLPSGLSLNSSGVISGTPTSTGTSTFTIRVTDSTSHTFSKSFNITISTALNITTSSLPNGRRGSFYNQPVSATGGSTPYTWSISSGNLPPGLTLNSTTGTISGTPTSSSTYTFTVRVTDSANPTPNTDTASLSIRITSY
jgi:large repetitive protein